jgi:hypothetical protein
MTLFIMLENFQLFEGKTASIFRVEELAQKMDAAVSFETFPPTYQTARRYIPEYDRENLKPRFLRNGFVSCSLIR